MRIIGKRVIASEQKIRELFPVGTRFDQGKKLGPTGRRHDEWKGWVAMASAESVLTAVSEPGRLGLPGLVRKRAYGILATHYKNDIMCQARSEKDRWARGAAQPDIRALAKLSALRLGLVWHR